MENDFFPHVEGPIKDTLNSLVGGVDGNVLGQIRDCVYLAAAHTENGQPVPGQIVEIAANAQGILIQNGLSPEEANLVLEGIVRNDLDP